MELHRSKIQMLLHDRQGKPKPVRIDYCTQSGERLENLLVKVTSVTDHGHHIHVVLPETDNEQHRTLLDTLILSVDDVRIR